MNDNTVILTYVGRGNFMFNVPARDLTQADVSASGYSLGQVLESHLYQPVPQPVPVQPVEQAAPVIEPAQAAPQEVGNQG